jgi:3-deoxy-manno-octulosonate cytidylyltransferase (CMP-KDO synthetase)
MVIAVIPSRYHSTRFPGKALVSLGSEPLITRVARRVLESGVADRVVVATDHEEIARAARRAGAEVWEDGAEYRSGSDRVAAAARAMGGAPEVVLNVQGDEVMVDREVLERAVAALPGNVMGTVAAPLDGEGLGDPDTVKVRLCEAGNRAADFSRTGVETARPLAHVGVYSFTPATLRRFTRLPTSRREREEGLEQLRFLEAGLPIGVRVLERRQVVAVNRPGDLVRVQAALDDLRHDQQHTQST